MLQFKFYLFPLQFLQMKDEMLMEDEMPMEDEIEVPPLTRTDSVFVSKAHMLYMLIVRFEWQAH